MFSIELTGELFDTVILHFFSKLPIKDIHWTELLSSISYEVQEEIIDRTVNSELITRYPINISYQKQFLKEFIHDLEVEESVIADSVYDAFGRLVALPCHSSNFYFEYYPIKNCYDSRKSLLPLIILKENINIISEGTTGLRTWQASQALAEWVLQNPKYVERKSILELGSGIGLTGLIVSLSANSSKYILTDCHKSVLSVLCDNVKLNTRENNETGQEVCSDEIILGTFVNSCEVQVRELFWEKTTIDSCKNYGSVDCLFAADVVYDSDLFEPLLNTVIAFFKSGTKEAIFACTERNSETLQSFWNLCGSKGLTVDFLKTPEPQHLTWRSDSPVFLSRIHLSLK